MKKKPSYNAAVKIKIWGGGGARTPTPQVSHRSQVSAQIVLSVQITAVAD